MSSNSNRTLNNNIFINNIATSADAINLSNILAVFSIINSSFYNNTATMGDEINIVLAS